MQPDSIAYDREIRIAARPETVFQYVVDAARMVRWKGIAAAQDGTSRVTVYVAVPDPRATLDRAEQLGGKTLMPPTEIPDVVTLAMFADPDGNVIGLIKS